MAENCPFNIAVWSSLRIRAVFILMMMNVLKRLNGFLGGLPWLINVKATF
jgi:hypothetical protein